MLPPAVRVGDDAPLFELTDQNEQAISLREYQGKLVILAFYGFAYNSKSERQLQALQTWYRKLKALNTVGTEVVVLGIGVERSKTNRAWVRQLGFEFPLLSDDGGSVARKYDLYDVKTKSARRANYVINPDGVITEAQWDDDTLEPEKLLRPPEPPPAQTSQSANTAGLRPGAALHLSLGVLGGMLKSCVRPDYPAKASADGQEGHVEVTVVISPEGKIQEARTDGEGPLQLAAVEAAKHWTFRPYQLSGAPTAVESRIIFRFEMRQMHTSVESTPACTK